MAGVLHVKQSLQLSSAVVKEPFRRVIIHDQIVASQDH
jgi:hypothetical protein